MGKNRKIYLLRHARVEIDEPRCIGITDIPLSDEGKRQAKKIAEWIERLGVRGIYSSPLRRCMETAEIITERLELEKSEIQIRRDLHEVDAGKWENRKFSELKKSREYEERGKNIGYYILPGGESFAQGGERFGKCLTEIRKETDEVRGDILVVAHAGVIRAYLCQLLGKSINEVFEISQPYVGITILEEKEDKTLLVKEIGFLPSSYMDQKEIKRIYGLCQTPENVIQHMTAVAAYMERIRKKIEAFVVQDISEEHPWYLQEENWKTLKKAALLHDIARTRAHHAKEGADILEREGYKELADLVRYHNAAGKSAGDSEKNSQKIPSMTDVLFYADKRVKDTRIVSVDERFEASYEKCKSKEAKEKHHRLYLKTMEIERQLEELTGGKLL